MYLGNSHLCLPFLRNAIINMMSNALFKHLLGNDSLLGENVPIATYIIPLPSQPMPITIDITSILGGLLYPLALSFLIPVSVCGVMVCVMSGTLV